MTRANRAPEFVERVNVMGGLPVLELDDGSHIAESIAICRYFEALHPEPTLLGATPKEQGVIDMWLRRIELNLMTPVGMVWIHGSPLTKAVVKKQIPEAAKQYRNLVATYYEFLDQQLSTREYIACDTYSIADIVALCTIDFAAALNDLPYQPDQENLTRWHESVSSRPSATA